MTSSFRSKLLDYLTYFVVWTVLGLFMFSQGAVQKIVMRDTSPWWHLFTSWMVGVYLWFVLTPLILWLGRRLPLEQNHRLRNGLIHFGLAPVIALGQLTIESATLRRIGVFPGLLTSFRAALVFLLTIAFHQGIMTYWSILGIQYAFGWYRRYEDRKREALRLELHSSQLLSQLAQAHLSALKMQIQPHFLFNTLNAIMVLVRQQKGNEAEEMLSRLSDLLRCVLDDVNTQEVPLRRELQYAQLYLSIEEVRFQDRLKVELVCDPEVLESAVPHMILQPLVENAIRHGIGRSSSAGQISIIARKVDGNVEMKVHDDGPGLSEDSNQPRGIGLANTRARLHELYGAAASLRIENDKQHGVIATVTLPYHRLPASQAVNYLESHAIHRLAG